MEQSEHLKILLTVEGHLLMSSELPATLYWILWLIHLKKKKTPVIVLPGLALSYDMNTKLKNHDGNAFCSLNSEKVELYFQL